MPAVIQFKITDAGRAAAINATANGLQLQITHVALGTGAYDSNASGAGMTALVNRKEQRAIDAGKVSGVGAFQIKVLFPAWTGSPSTYNATEIGLFAGDPAAGGTLFAVYSSTTDIIVIRNTNDFIASFTQQLVGLPPSSVTITVSPDPAYALAIVQQHENATDPHPQYLKKAGDTATGALRAPTASINDDSTILATSEFVNRRGVGYPRQGGIGTGSGDISLTNLQVGRWVDLQSNNGISNLPNVADVPIGAAFTVRCSVTMATVRAGSSDTIIGLNGTSGRDYPMVFGESAVFVSNGSNSWWLLTSSRRQPAGAVQFFAGNTAPSGWLKMNGALLSRAAYPALFAFAQATGGMVSDTDWQNNGYFGRFSTGTNGSDFRLPDARGMFLRAFDDGRGVDLGRIWGTFQDHDNRSHSHGLNDPGHAHTLIDNGHTHGASTDVQGNHVHGVNDPGHAHNSQYNWMTPSGIDSGNPSGQEIAGWGFDKTFPTSVSGTGISIQAAGAHGHNITVNGALANLAMYGNTTGISMQASGSEARPKNLALGCFISF